MFKAKFILSHSFLTFLLLNIKGQRIDMWNKKTDYRLQTKNIIALSLGYNPEKFSSIKAEILEKKIKEITEGQNLQNIIKVKNNK